MERVLFRSLSNEIRALRRRPSLWTAIFNGVVRRTKRSEAAARLQSQVLNLDLADCFRGLADSTAVEMTLAALYSGAIQLELLRSATFGTAAYEDVAFAALRRISQLSSAISTLEADGAFAPVRRTAAIRFNVGQPLEHVEHGPCVPYGWDDKCRAEEPLTATELHRSGGELGIVDNRKVYVGVDVATKLQPFYRVQLADGRGHYCAQELLEPLADGVQPPPIRGSSFFFTAFDQSSGRLVPRAELAARYPEDVASDREHSH